MRCLLVETSLALLVTTDLEVLAALDGVHAHSLAGVALEAEHNLLGGLSLLKHARRGVWSASGGSSRANWRHGTGWSGNSRL